MQAYNLNKNVKDNKRKRPKTAGKQNQGAYMNSNHMGQQ
jgi:hypothetical protein